MGEYQMTRLAFSKIEDLYIQLLEETVDADFLMIFTPTLYVGVTPNGDHSDTHKNVDREFLNKMNENQKCKTIVMVGLHDCYLKENQQCSQCNLDYVSKVMRVFNTSEVLKNVTFKILPNNNYRLYAIFKSNADPIIYMGSHSMAGGSCDELIVRVLANDELVKIIMDTISTAAPATFENLVLFLQQQEKQSGLKPTEAFEQLYG